MPAGKAGKDSDEFELNPCYVPEALGLQLA